MHLLIFGLGYTATRLAIRAKRRGWRVTATTRAGTAESCRLDSPEAVAAIGTATHILSSVPPTAGDDPVLGLFGSRLAAAHAEWIGYLSSTGVYGDAGGAWIDETAPLCGERRDRIAADQAWQALRGDVRVFRLPGIYGPGRSAVDQVRAGTAHRVSAAGQRFSRIHVDDIGTALLQSFQCGVPGVYNLADNTPAVGSDVVEYACDLMGLSYPPVISPDSSELSPMARSFYNASRLIAATQAQREFGFTPRYPDYRAGLQACLP